MVGSWAEHRQHTGCLGHTRVGSTPLLFQMVLTAYLVSTVSSLGEGRSGWDQLSNPANKPQSFTVITCTTISVTIVNNQTTTKTKTCSRSKNTTKAKQSTKALTTHTHIYTHLYTSSKGKRAGWREGGRAEEEEYASWRERYH